LIDNRTIDQSITRLLDYPITSYDRCVALDERDFFNNRNDTRTDQLTCPRCRRTNDYQMRWVVRTRKDRIPPGADERDRALFAKLRDYMIRVDDSVVCKTCGKRFDIPSQHSMVFLQAGDNVQGR
jgi:DNA-directed RNA polymerase subunit RPC12/RpoP